GVRNITFRASADRPNLFTITFLKVRDEFLVSKVLSEISNQRKFINFELWVFRRMGIIKSPLLERNVSADKI
ncbi:MAG: hypothetical protein II919_08790, partial [Lachnospiraceae bacterium]|nr:hypothetical protein [Lachnospiraceae bacterium]